ncbi:Uncharacterized protein DBV15_12584 [Temnothorax longispinosus]|uniref:Uncharacterized protein n=1 Tax=Temnothorax longispinosus TaxID=300112 RepID=A0A4V3SA19_9HYME|nr:Uncharacterized protein DBV15_12584 [Temnothorax longispinosus]
MDQTRWERSHHCTVSAASKLAVPTKLLNDATNNEAVDSLAESSSHLVSSVINSVDTPHVQDVSCIQLPISEDGQSLTAMEEADTIMIPTLWPLFLK